MSGLGRAAGVIVERTDSLHDVRLGRAAGVIVERTDSLHDVRLGRGAGVTVERTDRLLIAESCAMAARG